MRTTLGERELDVMAVLWRDGPGTAAEVQQRLAAELAYNTVSTILRNLEAKGFVDHTADGRLFHYFAKVTEQAARGTAVTRMVEKLFRGSALHVVTHMVESEALSPDELQALHDLLDRRLSSSSPSEDESTDPAQSKGAAGTRRRKR